MRKMFQHINSPIDWRRAYKQSKESWKQASQATPTHDMTYQNVDRLDSGETLGLVYW